MTKLQRTTFESSRAGEYFDARQLSALAGVPQGEFASVCLKELIDNALDAWAITANCFGEHLCGIGSAFVNIDVRSEKNHTGEEKEYPTEQTDYVPGPDAGHYKE